VLLASTAASAQTWRRVQGIDTTEGVYATAVQNGVFYAATDTLVYRSADGLVWQQTASQPAPGVRAYHNLYAHATGLYAGTVSNGVRRSTDGGQTWSGMGSGLPGEDVLCVAILGDSLFAGLGFSGVYVLSLSNPVAWTPYNTGLTQFGSNSIQAIDGRLFAGLGSNLFVRERGAAQWSTAVLGNGEQRQVYEVLASGGYLFAATSNGVFRASAAAPLAWESADIASMKNRLITSLAVQGSRLYAGLNASLQHWIWSTDDAALTWDVRAHEYTEIFELRFIGNRLWAGRYDGLWYYDFEPASVRRSPPAAREVPRAGVLRGRLMNGRRATAP
jgi:ligand-binding sensor domain-containing protein